MSEATLAAEWTAFSEHRPETAGIYRWRLPSVAMPGEIVTFLAPMRMRGSGRESVLSPSFDRWDGWRVIVPTDVEWQPVDLAVADPAAKARDEQIEIEGLTVRECPFCHRAPKWRGVKSDGRGVFLGTHPHEYNSWWLECCRWGSSPHVDSPHEIVRVRDAAFGVNAELLAACEAYVYGRKDARECERMMVDAIAKAKGGAA